VTTAIRHDTTTCVKWHSCRRPECRDRFNARRRALRAGTIQPSRILVDAEPVRQHITDLMDAGLSPTCIGRLAGVAHTTIWNFLEPAPSRGRGRKRHTTPETAAKILAVRALTTVGTLRRIQALIAVGWPSRKIAVRAGVSLRWMFELRADDVITIGHAMKIVSAYDELQHLKPEKNGVYPGHATRARERAKANRWPDPGYWNDRLDVIDDLHFEPLYGVSRREQIAQDASWVMRTTGVDKATAAARLGVSKAYVEHAFRDHPEYAVEVAA
jgi:hypothetical protein